MPVSNMRADGSSASKSGAGRWMSQRSISSKPSGASSSASPHTFHTWPSTFSPTGTVSPRPRLRTGVPRLRPSVGFMHTARTRPLPSCWATSASTDDLAVVDPMSNSTALLSSGSELGGNSTSITGPAMPTTRPSLSLVRLGHGHGCEISCNRCCSSRCRGWCPQSCSPYLARWAALACPIQSSRSIRPLKLSCSPTRSMSACVHWAICLNVGRPCRAVCAR